MEKNSLILTLFFIGMLNAVSAFGERTPEPENTAPAQVTPIAAACPQGTSSLSTLTCSASVTGELWIRQQTGSNSLQTECWTKLEPCMQADSCEMMGGTTQQGPIVYSPPVALGTVTASGSDAYGMNCAVSINCCIPN